jgi:long-chain acyl-CoA synthetase
MATRLFDIIEERSNATPDAVMMAAKENGNWRTYTCREIWETAQEMAVGLFGIGITERPMVPEQQHKIAIISNNRPEWMITDIAVQLTGAVLTPIYPTISPDELEFIFDEAEVSAVFVADTAIYSRFQEAFARSKSLKHVFSYDSVGGIQHWKTLLGSKTTAPLTQISNSIMPETLATIIFTSGTTGAPKGVMLTHKNIVSNVKDAMPVFTFAGSNSRALSFLPLNHIFERMVTYVYLNSGVSVYYAENMDTIGVNLREVSPVVFTTVPRLLEKIYERIMSTAIELKGIKRNIFFWALDLGLQYDNVKRGSLFYRLQLAMANKLVFNKWRAALGGKTKAIVVGSAACQERLVRVFSAAGIVVMEGYGLTETSPVVCVNRYESEGRRIGTIGPLIDHVEVKIAEDGEILTKGNNVTIGYYKHPELTAPAITDGWFHTGDIGTWVDNRFLKITDRKKEIFKTSGGKYVAPQVLENKMKESPFIEQIMVVGDGKKFVSALIVPNFTSLHKYLETHFPALATEEDKSKIVRMPEVEQLVFSQVEKFNIQFSHPEQIKKIKLLAHEWTIDTGELTPSLKMKRKVMLQKFGREVDAMYAE